MAGPFVETNMAADQFKAEFEAVVTTRYHGAWTLFAETPKGFLPVGFVFAFSHTELSPFLIIAAIVWCPWATARNKVEAAVCFFNRMRKEIPVMIYSRHEDRKFVETMAKHGVIQRVGTTFNMVRGVGIPIFETRDK